MYLVIFYNYFFGKGEVLAKETSEEIKNFDVKISNAKEIKLEELPQDERELLEDYYEKMRKELDISISISINNLLK